MTYLAGARPPAHSSQFDTSAHRAPTTLPSRRPSCTKALALRPRRPRCPMLAVPAASITPPPTTATAAIHTWGGPPAPSHIICLPAPKPRHGNALVEIKEEARSLRSLPCCSSRFPCAVTQPPYTSAATHARVLLTLACSSHSRAPLTSLLNTGTSRPPPHGRVPPAASARASRRVCHSTAATCQALASHTLRQPTRRAKHGTASCRGATASCSSAMTMRATAKAVSRANRLLALRRPHHHRYRRQ